jgi:hypothetical protein
MKKNLSATFFVPFGVFCFLGCLFGGVRGAQSQAQSSGQAIEAVRIWNGDQFVSDLNLQDFELKENGVAQTLDALFLVDKNSVIRKDGPVDFLPDVSRKFYLLFQLNEYNAQLSQAIRYFFREALLPGDSLYIQTPMKNYALSPAAFAGKPRDVLARELDDIVRKDIIEGGMAYRSALSELKVLVRRISGQNPMSRFEEGSAISMDDFSVEQVLPQVRDALMHMENLRTIDGDKILGFAKRLKRVAGQKIVFLIYQREFSPELSPAVMNELVSMNQDSQNVLNDLHELFQVYHRPLTLNPEGICQALADSSTNFNFLFMDKAPDRFGGLVMRERSEDAFKVFSAAARATGGIIDTAQNPEAAVKDALKACATYYLLYYTPAPRLPDGSFKAVMVGVKGKDYRVVGRQGYFKN